jgi:hypothetical protein
LGEAPRVNFQTTKVNAATTTRAAAARRMVLVDLVIVFMCVISFDLTDSAPRLLARKHLIEHWIEYTPYQCKSTRVVVKESLVSETCVIKVRLVEENILAAMLAFDREFFSS